MNRTHKAAFTATIAAPILAVGIYALPAWSHTPAISASCEGVVGSMSNTPADVTTTVTIRVDDSKTSASFAGNGAHSVPVPQDGAVHFWQVEIDSSADQYDRFERGEVGPCGEEPTEEPTPTEEPSPTPTLPPVPSEPPVTETPEPTSTPEDECADGCVSENPPTLSPPSTLTPPTSTEPVCVGGSLQWTETDAEGNTTHHSDASAAECERKADEPAQIEEGM